MDVPASSKTCAQIPNFLQQSILELIVQNLVFLVCLSRKMVNYFYQHFKEVYTSPLPTSKKVNNPYSKAYLLLSTQESGHRCWGQPNNTDQGIQKASLQRTLF